MPKVQQRKKIETFLEYPKIWIVKSKEWLINCGREELCSKSVDNLYNNYYRVCMNHFKANMFSNPEKTRLLISAVPTEFVMHTTITTTSISVDVSTMVDKQINLSSPSTCKFISVFFFIF
ncbi:uncharacterized protein LOC100574815 [Acyrthosiphon pisum]|uniref:THAP-type domain-containing protein n=1 Tax=Acyrthosiphon pisum TaxID=7029 RepID=A0A8R2JSA1_ACYPI|nr:uncharacterized protein LOC100574815 [Acyrthosiphon pisum]